jgi:SAM-dependent methyltransferase
MDDPIDDVASSPPLAPWSEDLEQLHQESSRTHFLDIWTRSAITSRLGLSGASPVIVDVGCSTGYLLEDLRNAYPAARLSGLDFIYSGLRQAHENLPRALLVQADAQAIPLATRSADAIVSANLLEHVPDDVEALRQMYKVMKPGAPLLIVVPAGRQLYDYYDRFLHHQRRYGRGELASKARLVGFEVQDDIYLGTLVYPAFWLVKKRNRLFRDSLSGEALERQVSIDIANTKDSRLGQWSVGLERLLISRSVKLGFGVRELVVLKRPSGS